MAPKEPLSRQPLWMIIEKGENEPLSRQPPWMIIEKGKHNTAPFVLPPCHCFNEKGKWSHRGHSCHLPALWAPLWGPAWAHLAWSALYRLRAQRPQPGFAPPLSAGWVRLREHILPSPAQTFSSDVSAGLSSTWTPRAGESLHGPPCLLHPLCASHFKDQEGEGEEGAPEVR